MSPDEDRPLTNGKSGNNPTAAKTNGAITNGTATPTTNPGSLVPPQNGQRKRNSTTVPPIINPTSLLNNERIVYRPVLTGGK